MNHRLLALSFAVAAVVALAPAALHAAGVPNPTTVISAAEVGKTLGGTFKQDSPEEGVLFFNEEGGASRVVEVDLWAANGKTVDALRQQAEQDGEKIEDAPAGLGDAAMYRPQHFGVTVQKTDKAGTVLWLTISVQNVPAAAETKKQALALAKLIAPRL
ncbi:MAG: hypothetical protein ABI609_10835 [Acidobacteriota bacterium]